MRQLLPVVLALLLGAPGCATYLAIEVARHDGEFPAPFCGVALHVELSHGVPGFDLQLLDLLGCVVLDVGLLPVTVPGWLLWSVMDDSPRPLHHSPQPSPEVVQARRAQAVAAQAQVRPAPPPTFEDALLQARRVAPEDAELHARLAPGGVESILYTEEGQLAIPDLTRMEIDERLARDARDGVALAALGAAWARAGDLDRAEAYLRLGAMLCRLPRNAALVKEELARVVAARGR